MFKIVRQATRFAGLAPHCTRTAYKWRTCFNAVRFASTSHSTDRKHVSTVITAQPSDPKTPNDLLGSSVEENGTMLDITWADGEVSRYPLLFLRDNCTCSKCRNNSMKERVINYWCVSDVGTECQADEIEGNSVALTWSDGHKSTFSSEFLREFTFPEEKRLIIGYGSLYEREFWDTDRSPPRFDYRQVMSEDTELLKYIKLSLKFGLTIMQNMPTNPEEIFRFGERICYLKDTLYGPTFHVKTTNDPANVGYSPVALYLHSDQPNYSYQPEVMLLQCLEQPNDGGDSEIADAMKSAYILKETNREAYNLLKEVNVRFDDYGKDSRGKFLVATDKPVILEDNYGEIDVIRLNDYRRGILVNSTPETVHKWYKAYDELKRLVSRPENVFKYKLKQGEMLTIDNRRMLHGRRGHEAEPQNRWMIGAFIGMDEYVSKMRILQEDISA